MAHTNDDEAMARLVEAAQPVMWRARNSETEEWQHFNRRPSWREVQPLYAHPPQPSEMIAAVERAFDEIRELNMSGRDENGHRWANSDLIDQTVTEGLVALRALKGSDNG